MKKATFFGHPVGLFILFFTEMWERFSYYGMRALLVLYMTHYLLKNHEAGNTVFGFSTVRSAIESVFGPLAIQPLASQIYGLYTGLVFFTPLLGGFLADRYLGKRKSVVIGGVLMAIGQFLLVFESLFFAGLLVLIIGNGFFKPNISTQVGTLYEAGDPRRDRAFSIFYMGINLGAFFAPLVCGTLGQIYGWHYGFATAGIGMIIGVLVYLLGQPYLVPKEGKGEEIHPKVQSLKPEPITSQEWKAIAALLVLGVLNIVFWAVYEQQGNTIQLFADQNTDWHILGWEMPSTWLQAINPACIFLFTPLLNKFWTYQAKRNTEPCSIAKMSIGCFLLGLSFLGLVAVTLGMTDSMKIHFMWLVACTSVYTLGELYLSPIGLSLVTKVAPARFVGMMMGMWLLSSFFGNYLSGYLGEFYETMPKERFFMMLAMLGGLAGAAIFALQQPLKKAVEQT